MALSASEKLKEIERELGVRRSVYPGWIDQNKISRKLADDRIKALEEIAEDYREMAKKERLL